MLYDSTTQASQGVFALEKNSHTFPFKCIFKSKNYVIGHDH